MSAKAILCAVLSVGMTGAQQVRPLGVYLQHHYSRPDSIEWERIKNSGDVQSLQSFVSRYPTSRYAKAAVRRLVQIEPAPQVAPGPDSKLVENGPYTVRVVPKDSSNR